MACRLASSVSGSKGIDSGFGLIVILGSKDLRLAANFAIKQAICSGLCLRPPWPIDMLKVSSIVQLTPTRFFFQVGSGTMGESLNDGRSNKGLWSIPTLLASEIKCSCPILSAHLKK